MGDEAITEGDLGRRIDQVEARLDYMRNEAEAGGPSFLEACVTAIEDAGIRTVALAGEIQDAALRDYARRHGYTVSLEEVASEVSRATACGHRAAGRSRHGARLRPGLRHRRLLAGGGAEVAGPRAHRGTAPSGYRIRRTDGCPGHAALR